MLSIVSMAASIDGHLPFLAAGHCNCTYYCFLIVLFFTGQINSVLFCTLVQLITINK